MSHLAMRMTGLATILAAVSLAFWLVFGAPRDWDGGMRFLRLALGLGCLGVIRGGAKLVFPDTGDDTDPGEAPDRPQGDGRGTRV
ncbi:hypothetical protein E4N62_29985 [Streptomyces sp. MNU76]|uniref:hypothetical protein n=1 Tax=Streptomyces sp. MNU76 TaxID=2560026 RepID=UPI001E2E5970|nr:hypothetical protein [Streptomyces sp. MNU76]MCC9709107.1 hypothetical protein [Streptomyces sp. MNU76]